jgi:asparagine synthase (glutamine-hydrolysing)
MCGIYLFKFRNGIKSDADSIALYKAFMKLKKRGPERSRFLVLHDLGLVIGFHRLAIMDSSTKGDQPFVIETADGRTIYTICNGEIYNYKYLQNKYSIDTTSGSDCELLPHIYAQIGIDGLCKELASDHVSGEFAILIVDIKDDVCTIHAVRDPVGVRPLFLSTDGESQSPEFSSELKGLSRIKEDKPFKVTQFPAGTYTTYTFVGETITNTSAKYFDLTSIKPTITDLSEALALVRSTFELAVMDRMHADRKIAFLLSGGLDSSLVTAVGAKYAKKMGKEVVTISIGMPGSTDEYYARLVSKWIGSTHIHVQLSESDFLNAIDEVIETIESFDITTVRASTGQYLVSKWIAKHHPDIKVLYIGDGSDELFGGYRYFLKAPSPAEYSDEIVRLLQYIKEFDVLRADRGIASNGIEARVPFLDHRLITAVLSIDPKLRMAIGGVEKWLLREAFNGTDLLPNEILFRTKEAFSDGVSSVERSWYKILQEHLETVYTDDQLANAQIKYTHCPPPTKEALYFREKFGELFGESSSNVIPFFWLPKWVGDIKEPSARVLSVYQSE